MGDGGRLPWRLPGELRHFRARTQGCPVILGRQSFAEIGKPLPGRHLIVLTRDPGSLDIPPDPGIEAAGSLDGALSAAAAAARRLQAHTIWAGGGRGVWAACMPLATRLEITRVALRPAGDTRFPAIDADTWHCRHTGAWQNDAAAWRLENYTRR